MNTTHKNNAFTLAELLMVIAIISILGGVLMPILADSSSFQINAAVRELNSIILYTQNLAISNQQKYQITFSTANNSYEVADENGNLIDDPGQTAPSNTDEPDKYKLKRQFSQDSNFNKVTITTADFDNFSILWFDRLGMPYSGPIINNTALTNGQITLTAKNRNITMNIEPISGNITF